MNDTNNLIEYAKNVVKMERDSIDKMIDFVDNKFIDTVKTIFYSKGRIIVTGIGKSAIIGQKIVATLNSTGSPSVFMHAADAIHGDLGIIQQNDTVICISKSGNTPEIKVLIPLIRNIDNNNTIIGMVGNVDSFLSKNCDYVVNTSVEKEACPNNLAPTCSTTAQLVMGDVIAMTLLKMRGFSSSDFAKVHPGGALGKRLYVRVYDLIIQEEKPSVNINSSIEDVIIEISSKRLGATAVLDDNGNLCGIITDGDIRRMLHAKYKIHEISAKDIMSENPKTIDINSLAVEAFATMEENKITQLIVSDKDSNYRGIVHIHAILKEGVV